MVARRAFPLVVGILLGLASPVVARNTHTVSSWYHGLGDGKNDNGRVHPFNHNEPGRASDNSLSLAYYSSSGSAHRKFLQTCNCRHNHRDWDTSPHRECRYVSGHEAKGRDALNFNLHYHHDECI